MPFESPKQRAFLYANKPDVARKFAEHSKKKRDPAKDAVKKATNLTY